MLIRRIKNFTNVFKAPRDWDAEQAGRCGDLAVRIVEVPGAGHACESAWEPTPAELAALNAGGSVILRVFGGQPPVAVYVDTQDAVGPVDPG